jgi:hypothetical protein
MWIAVDNFLGWLVENPCESMKAQIPLIWATPNTFVVLFITELSRQA